MLEREGFQGFLNKLTSALNKGKDEVLRSTKISKARLDLSSLKKERRRVFERLGEEIYKRHKERKISAPGLESLITEIDLIGNHIDSKERELKNLAGEVIQKESPQEEKKSTRKRHIPREKTIRVKQV